MLRCNSHRHLPALPRPRFRRHLASVGRLDCPQAASARVRQLGMSAVEGQPAREEREGRMGVSELILRQPSPASGAPECPRDGDPRPKGPHRDRRLRRRCASALPPGARRHAGTASRSAPLRPEPAAAERAADSARAWSPDVKAHTELAHMLEGGRIDAIINITPAPLHGPISRVALEAGVHVYSEKPIA